MNYRITIERTEPDPNYAEEIKQYKDNMQWGNNFNKVPPKMERITNALMVELTEAQYNAVKAAVLTEFI